MIELGQDSVVCIATHYGLKVKERVELYLYSHWTFMASSGVNLPYNLVGMEVIYNIVIEFSIIMKLVGLIEIG